METIVIIALALGVPSVIGLLAIVFGADSRQPYTNPEYALASTGMTWETARRSEQKKLSRIIPATVPTARYPLLAAIDVARDPASAPFSVDPQAARLEQCARDLARETWNDSVWLTGLVSHDQLNALAIHLQAERMQIRDGTSQLVMQD